MTRFMIKRLVFKWNEKLGATGPRAIRRSALRRLLLQKDAKNAKRTHTGDN
jgi:hypothetical protein